MAETANRSRGSGRRVRGAFAPEARCGYRNPTLSSILATQMPCRSCRERCLSRSGPGIVRCCLSVSVLQRSKTPYHKPYCRQLLFLFISFFRRVFQFLVAFFIHRNCRLHQRKGEHDRNNAGHTSNSQAMGRQTSRPLRKAHHRPGRPQCWC